jgi:WD40 repeat protein
MGSIPTAPAPSGRNAEMSAAKTPNRATDLASNRADEISIITYSDHFSMIATGSLDGDVILWDFEND